MRVDHLWVTDFRSYTAAELALAGDGLTVVVGSNGAGKTNLLEAVGYLATLGSFRGAPDDALVRAGAAQAVVRAEGERDGRRLLVEAEINTVGRNRTLLNRQPLRRARDLLGALRVSVFSPDDLALVKGGPSERRRWMDDTLVAVHAKHDALRSDLERVLRQRGTLLKQAGGRATPDVVATLDVWDAKLAQLGEAWAEARTALVADVVPVLRRAYQQLADTPVAVDATYVPSWFRADGTPRPLAEALEEGRKDDLRRGVSLVGPHRDDLVLTLAGLPGRTHASQGEQRSLSLSLRLAAHEVVTAAAGSAPILLLDDVFSELDPGRSAALLRALPPGQALLTTAGVLPATLEPARVLRIDAGTIGAAA